MIKKEAYKYLASVIIILLLAPSINAQLLDSLAFDTAKTFTLEQALKKDPLKVYKLKLKGKKLKELPDEIYQFKNLNSLDISKNKLSVFPQRINEFQYLQDLDVSSNKIEVVTKEIGLLLHLKEFKANQNSIVSIPPEIRFCKKLRYIDLWGNDIGALPYEIADLSETLEELDMRVILMSNNEHEKIKELLPKTKIKFSKSCNCGF